MSDADADADADSDTDADADADADTLSSHTREEKYFNFFAVWCVF